MFHQASLLAIVATCSLAWAQEPVPTPAEDPIEVPAKIVASLQGIHPDTRKDGLTALEKAAAAVDPERRERFAWHSALLLADSEPAVSDAAVATLVTIYPHLAPHRETLLGLRDPFQEDYIEVEEEVQADEPDIAANIARLASTDPVERVHAVDNLCSLGQQAAAAQGRLLKLLQDPHPDVRAAVARGVARLGWSDAVRAGLVTALRDSSAHVRKNAAEGMSRQDDETVVRALRGALQDPDVDVRCRVLSSLGTSGEAGAAAADDVIATLRDRETDVRIAALDALGRLGLTTPRAIQGVRHCLRSDDLAEIKQGLNTANRLKTGAHALLDQVIPLIDHPDGALAYPALLAGWSIAGPEVENRGRLAVHTIESLGSPHSGFAGSARWLLVEWVTGR